MQESKFLEKSKNKSSSALEQIANKYIGNGLTGLVNLGNTCFMNSVLQCLSHTYELNDFLDTESYKKPGRLNKKPDSLLLCEWDNLRKLMWSENCIIKPRGFLAAVHKVALIKDREMFTGFAQNDLTEFLQLLTECFHNAISRGVQMLITGIEVSETDKLAKTCYEMMKNMYEKEYSEFLNMFFGIHVSQIKSLESDYLNVTPEPFFNLLLPITDETNQHKHTLEECFELYTEEETLDSENGVLNQTSNKRETAVKRILFWSLPDILVVTLKRFGNNMRKNQRMINFPLENLDLSKYVVGYDSNSYIYDLYGICNHSGGVMGGHYTAFVKNANNKWYLYNDRMVAEVKNLGALKSPKAYCFFYRKQKK